MQNFVELIQNVNRDVYKRQIPNVLLTSAHGKWYPLKYFVFVLAVGLVFLFGRGVVEGVISLSLIHI